MSRGKETFDFGDAKFIGLAGALNAGKDIGAEHWADEHELLHVSTGDMLRAEARKNGLDTDRNTLIDLGIRLRAEYGSQGALIIKAAEKWQNERDNYRGGLVVTGMRAVGEAQEILHREGLLIYVDTMTEIGFRRMQERDRDSEVRQTLKQYTQHRLMEEYGDPKDPTRPNLRAIMKMSHVVLNNNYHRPEPYFRELDEAAELIPCGI